MSKCSKLKRSLWRIKPMKRVFWSFEFLSFGIVSNLVLLFEFSSVEKEACSVAPFRGLPHTTSSTGGR